MAINTQNIFRSIWKDTKTNDILISFRYLKCPHCGIEFVYHSGLSCPDGRGVHVWPLNDFLAKLKEKEFSVSLSDISKLIKAK